MIEVISRNSQESRSSIAEVLMQKLPKNYINLIAKAICLQGLSLIHNFCALKIKILFMAKISEKCYKMPFIKIKICLLPESDLVETIKILS